MQAFCSVVIEAIVALVVFVIVVKQGVDTFVLPFVVAIQCNKVVDNEFTHETAPSCPAGIKSIPGQDCSTNVLVDCEAIRPHAEAKGSIA